MIMAVNINFTFIRTSLTSVSAIFFVPNTLTLKEAIFKAAPSIMLGSCLWGTVLLWSKQWKCLSESVHLHICLYSIYSKYIVSRVLFFFFLFIAKNFSGEIFDKIQKIIYHGIWPAKERISFYNRSHFHMTVDFQQLYVLVNERAMRP